jgi:hypothetical protein
VVLGLGRRVGFLAEAAIVVVSLQRDPLAIAVLLVVAIVLAALAIYAGWRTRGFALFGAAIFSTVLIFGTVQAIYGTYRHPRLQAAAILRSGPDFGFTGFYIAETSDRVYLARIPGERYETIRGKKTLVVYAPALPRIVILPRRSIVGMLIGPPQPSVSASEESGDLLKELCKNKVRPEKTGDPRDVTSPCPPPVAAPPLEEKNESNGEARHE